MQTRFAAAYDVVMSRTRRLLGPVLIYLATACVFLAADLHSVSYAPWDWTVLPAILGQTLALTVIVGSWICAMTYFERESGELGGSRGVRRAAPAGSFAVRVTSVRVTGTRP
jgi:hypothetical protein